MKKQNGLLLVGGASRNTGKTTLVCKIIEKFSGKNSIIALKLKTIYEGDKYFHGKESRHIFSDYYLTEDKNKESTEDTGKMLRAGAKRAFLLRSKAESLKDAFSTFLSEFSEYDLIVCESNSLRKIAEPDLFLFIKSNLKEDIKPSASEIIHLADKIIISDGISHDLNLESLQIEDYKWKFKS